MASGRGEFSLPSNMIWHLPFSNYNSVLLEYSDIIAAIKIVDKEIDEVWSMLLDGAVQDENAESTEVYGRKKGQLLIEKRRLLRMLLQGTLQFPVSMFLFVCLCVCVCVCTLLPPLSGMMICALSWCRLFLLWGTS